MVSAQVGLCLVFVFGKKLEKSFEGDQCLQRCNELEDSEDARQVATSNAQ